MKIAVPYENGNVFQHFGHSEKFKIYDVENGSIIRAEIVDTNGNGHSALATFLADNGVTALICGGIGDGAKTALQEAGIDIFAGADGSADEAVNAFILGQLEYSEGECCDHHCHDDDCDCGDHDCDCGHCHGDDGCDCGCEMPHFEGKNVGKKVRAHYRGTFNDGTQFDSSYDRGEPLEFICGAGQMIYGFDAAVANMEVGQISDIHLMPSEAYGEYDPDAVFTVEIAQMPGSENVTAGQHVYLYDHHGHPFPVTVTAKDEKTVTFDANHEMAGKELNFRIELVEVYD